LVLDVLLNRGFRNVPNCASVVRTAPQGWHPRHQMWELLSKYSTAGTLETVYYFRNAPRWVGRYEQMNVVRHDFHSFDEHAVLLRRGIQNVFKPCFHVAYKNFAAILRAEHYVVRQVKDGSCVFGVTTISWLLYFHVIRVTHF